MQILNTGEFLCLNIISAIMIFYHQVNEGVDSHAEVNAVREAMKKWPDANPEDFLVYVNDTGGKTSIPTSEKPFIHAHIVNIFYKI